jgi:hypothetical protein
MRTTTPTHNEGIPDAFTEKEYPISASRWRRCGAWRWLPAGLWRQWLYAYGGVWAATLAPAILIAPVRQALKAPIRSVLKATLSAQHNPPPTLGHVLVLAAHNIPLTAWPLLLGPFGAHRSRFQTHLADGLLVACVTVNTLQVAVALDAYGSALLPYVPQLPVEWAAYALGASGWLLQRKHALGARERRRVFALIVCLVVLAAVLETIAVPHR